MLKHEELADIYSCLNKARDDEQIFVLLERDDAMANTLRFWAAERIKLRLNRFSDLKITSTLSLARHLDESRLRSLQLISDVMATCTAKNS